MTTRERDDRVLIRRCERYDRAALQRLVTEGMQTLGFTPRGKTFVKPNVVFAGDPTVFGRHAYTHPELMGAALLALAEGAQVERVDLGENSAVGFPTRHCYQHAGYYEEVARVRQQAARPVDLFCMDEDRYDVVPVNGEVHETLRLSRTMARADTKVYLPKLKCHCVTRMTGAVKLNIGICNDADRSFRHDYSLTDKIVDLLTPGWPDFIVMDAIEVGVGNEGVPTPRDLGLVLMGTNPVAIDLVGARLLGLARDDVPYLRRAVERGYGPASVEQVTLLGDLESLGQIDVAAKRLEPYDSEFRLWQDIDTELARLQTPLRFAWGPHRHGQGERCEGGCAMAIKMFLASCERYAGAEAFRKAKPITFVVGTFDEPFDGQGREVFLIGKCADGRVENARKVVRIRKCFTTASDLTRSVSLRLGIPTPVTNPRLVGGLVKNMAHSSLSQLWKRVTPGK